MKAQVVPACLVGILGRYEDEEEVTADHDFIEGEVPVTLRVRGASYHHSTSHIEGRVVPTSINIALPSSMFEEITTYRIGPTLSIELEHDELLALMQQCTEALHDWESAIQQEMQALYRRLYEMERELDRKGQSSEVALAVVQTASEADEQD